MDTAALLPVFLAALAIIGARACDLAALALQDAHFLRQERADPHYARRREQLFLVAVQCAEPAATCFCACSTAAASRSSCAELGGLFIGVLLVPDPQSMHRRTCRPPTAPGQR